MMAERNAEMPKARRILYRTGVNLGDVLTPVVLTMRPPWLATIGAAASRRSRTARAVPASSSPISLE
jgi:hypothetical protein